MRYQIIIDGIPPSNNKYMGKTYHFEQYQEKKREWHLRVKAAIKERLKTPFDKAVVKLTYHFRDRIRRDPDNYSGKFILDALVKEGIIKDDSFNCVTLILEQGEPNSKRPNVEVEVVEL